MSAFSISAILEQVAQFNKNQVFTIRSEISH